MATPAERLVDVTTRRMDAVEEDLREMREVVTDLRLAQARIDGGALVWGRLVPIGSLLTALAALFWRVVESAS